MNKKIYSQTNRVERWLEGKTDCYVANQSGTGPVHIFDKLHGHTRPNECEFSDGLEEMRTIRSETNPTCLLDSSEKYAHVLSNYDLRRVF